MTHHHAVDPNCPVGQCWVDPNGFDCVHVTNPKRAALIDNIRAQKQPCKLCRERADEIGRLKQIIAQQDERLLRLARERAEHHEQMMAHLERLRESQELLRIQIEGGRKL